MTRVVSIVLNEFVNDARVLKEAISLQKAGYSVSVIAMHDGDLDEETFIKEIPVHRIKLKSRNWSKHKIVQLFKYFEFIFRALKKIKKNADIVHCNDLEALPVGVLAKLFNRKIKVVYDAHEYETEMHKFTETQKKIVRFVEKLFIYKADKVFTVSDSIANEYVKNYHIEKPALVLNCPAKTDVPESDIFRETFNIPKEHTIFLYQGGFTTGRGIENILEAFKKTTPDKVIVFMGYGILEPVIKKATQEYPNMYYQPAVPPDLVLNYTVAADIGLSFIENTCLSYYYCLPNKIFEYIMAGLPVLVSDLYEMRRIVAEYDIGYVVKQNTPEGIYEIISKVDVNELKKKKKHVEKLKALYNWENQEKILVDTYKKITL